MARARWTDLSVPRTLSAEDTTHRATDSCVGVTVGPRAKIHNFSSRARVVSPHHTPPDRSKFSLAFSLARELCVHECVCGVDVLARGQVGECRGNGRLLGMPRHAGALLCVVRLAGDHRTAREATQASTTRNGRWTQPWLMASLPAKPSFSSGRRRRPRRDDGQTEGATRRDALRDGASCRPRSTRCATPSAAPRPVSCCPPHTPLHQIYTRELRCNHLQLHWTRSACGAR